tara:strand:+ start:1998 stop:2645 length:648 start_codon:yes stop_codon:yes gene_type:complete
MPSIYANLEDGTIVSTNTSGWSAARDATSGNFDYSANNSFINAVMARKARGTRYGVNRAFFSFDTSDIDITPSDATLKIYGLTNDSANFFVVKANHGGLLGVADFDAIDGWSNSGVDNEGNVTKYSSEITSWSTSGYNNITLNSTALSDMVSLDDLQVCLIESTHDLRNVAPTGAPRIGMYYADETGTSKDPYIDYTEGTLELIVHNSVFFGSNF